jgi:saccharopine dehydrogenase-like NADP-dependent oxidoreductase
MHRVLLLGAGKIGRMIAHLLHRSGDYDVTVADASAAALDKLTARVPVKQRLVHAEKSDELKKAMEGQHAVLSALSYHHNPSVADAALAVGCCYFDLTEDVETTRRVRAIATHARPQQIFMPQCGLAPGFISIVANHLIAQFDTLDTVRMRVGALPQFPTDALKYNLTWSTDGLINEYCNPCEAIVDGKLCEVQALEGREEFLLDGDRYEAFNTSGGLGTLCESLNGSLRFLDYKTIRYLGHRDLVAFLIQDLRLGQRRDLMKDILEHAVPITFQDVVITFCTVKGMRRGQFVQYSDARKIYCQTINGEIWSAIQITTAAGICAVLDIHMSYPEDKHGFVRQEEVDFTTFRTNRFGRYYDQGRIVEVTASPE